MGSLLLARTPEAEQQQRAPAILEHLNRALAHIDEDMRLTVIRLNLGAGKSALANGAAVAAEQYLSVGRHLLRSEDWQSERSLGVELFFQSTDSALLRRDFETALALLQDLDDRAPSLMESAHIEVRRVQVLVATKSPEECSRYALKLLVRHGIRWPLHPSPIRARFELRRVLWRLRLTRGELLHKATQVEPRRLAPILITGACGAVMARFDVHLVVLLSCWIMSLNLRRGYVSRPHFSLLAFATWIQVVLGNTPKAQQLAQLSEQWMERVPDPVFKPRFEMQLHGILRPWWTPRRECLAQLDRLSETMRELGDLEYAYYARFMRIAYGALAGDCVPEAEAAFADLANEVRRSGQRYSEPARCHAVYRMLLSAEPAEIEREIVESEPSIASSAGNIEIYVRTFWMLVLCVHGRHESALDQSDRVKRVLFRIVPYIHVADHTFLRALALASTATTSRIRGRRRRHLTEFTACLARIQRWAKHGKDFVHMHTFLLAERAGLRGDAKLARSLYDRAARGAAEQGYLHHAALACERRARLLASQRRETEAAQSLGEAIALYSEWGSQPKVDALAQERRLLLGS